MTHLALRSNGLTKTFRGADRTPVAAVDHLDLAITPGEVVAFLGPNGAGKTTTLDMVLGMTRPDSGEIEVFGLPPQQAARSGRIAAVMQTGGLQPDFTVEETVRVVAALHGGSVDPAAAMARADLAHIAGRTVSKCSGGEQQRLKFALALLPDPDLIVLDEPTAGMDVESRRAFWAAMRTDAMHGRTVLFATHYLEEADSFADRIVMISGGRIVADGPTADIRARAGGRVVSAVLDEPDIARVLASVPHATEVERRGGRVYLGAQDSDELARFLLTDTAARDVEISAHTLEDAFLELTA
ncbi:ABC transporter ATP-binding protein [Gordonia hankookensis]|uniref:ABC transporter ATP-binding protein n=1 Tax=Gordonia hankookensis TaxID=589403 RepID=A0ABR7WEC0_9ACTN|nr:ABC transporter ATP-binding protein [Gordonia hankookensis]MBD1321125.1 ABC transporter ATP-binding protein [Gordonia hankookensis]